MSTFKNCINRHCQSTQTLRKLKMCAHLNDDALFANILNDFAKVVALGRQCQHLIG